MMRGHYAVLSSNVDIYFDLGYTKACALPIDSQKKKVSKLVSYMQLGKEVSKLGSQELKNVFSNFYLKISPLILISRK